MKKLISLLLCIMMLLSIAVSASGLASVPITGLKVDKPALSLEQNGTYALKITLVPATTTQKLLVLSTTNANVATVDTDGKITATGAGKAEITVASKSNPAISAKVTVTVTKKKPIVLRVEVYDRGNAGGTAPDNNYWTKWIQTNYGDKNNVTLKFEPCIRFDNNAKLTTWMASNSAPDLCYTNEPDPVSNFHNNGGLADLNASLDKYGAQLKDFLGDYLLTKGIDQKTGERYLLRAKKVIDANETTWIRKDWLDKLGLPMPTTRDEWYNDMKAFKDQNPDKMGRVIPFALANDVGWQAQNLIESFFTDKSDMARYVTNNRWMQIFAPGAKEAVRFMNKMYNEGLISKEFALDAQYTIYNSDIISGFVGSFINNYDLPLRAPSPGILVNLQAKWPTAKLVPCDPFKDKDGKYTKQLSDVAGIQMFVPKTSKDKTDEVIKYLNWMCDADTLYFLQFGEEGKNHVMTNGIPQVISAKGDTIQNSPNNIDYTMVVNGVIGKTKDDTILRNSLAYSGDTQQLYVQAWKLGISDGYVGPAAKMNQNPDADAKYGSTITNKANEVYAKTISCKPEEFDDVWNQQTQAMLRAGASEMMAQRKALWLQLHPKK